MPDLETVPHVPRERLDRRLRVLSRLDAAGGLPVAAFDRLTRLATAMTGAPVGLAVLVDDERQVFVSHVGLGEPWASRGETPLTHSFCQHVAATGAPLVVADARVDDRLRDNLAIRDLGVVAYAGMPLAADGECVGSFCLIDSAPREWSARDLAVLSDLTAAAAAELALHLALAEQAEVVGELASSETRYRSLLAAMVDGVVLQASDGAILECNEAAESILGLTADQMSGRSSMDPRWRSVREDGSDFPGPEHPSMQTLASGKPLRDVTMGVHKPTGELTWISISSEPLFDGDSKHPYAVVCSFTDITARRQGEIARERYAVEQDALRALATLVASDSQPRAVFAAAAKHVTSVMDCNLSGIVRLDASGQATLVGAWAPPHIQTPAIGEPVDLEARLATGAAIKTGRPASLVHPPGNPNMAGIGASFAVPIHVDNHLWGALTIAFEDQAVAKKSRAILGRLGRFADLVSLSISSSEAREQLARLASTDHLTGLYNQRAFADRLDEEVRRSGRHGRPLSLVVFDIDHFKIINDTHGHAAGNQALAEFAERLIDLRRGGEILARVGGEEFAWILPETDAAGAFAAAERARTAIASTPFAGIGQVTTSAGVCALDDADDARQLFRHADLALYWAKSNGRNVTFRYQAGSLEFLSGDEQARRLKDATTLAAIRALATAVDAKDPSTQRHSERVAELSAALAAQAGWSTTEIALLRDAALVHDVGKIGVPDTILLKPDKLSREEYDQIKLHAALGAQMVADVVSPIQTQWIRHHHERFDGNGYPDGIAGNAIPEGGRLMALADAWDAMTVARPYGAPRTIEDALDEVKRAAGTHFCPDAVNHLLQLHATERITTAR